MRPEIAKNIEEGTVLRAKPFGRRDTKGYYISRFSVRTMVYDSDSNALFRGNVVSIASMYSDVVVDKKDEENFQGADCTIPVESAFRPVKQSRKIRVKRKKVVQRPQQRDSSTQDNSQPLHPNTGHTTNGHTQQASKWTYRTMDQELKDRWCKWPGCHQFIRGDGGRARHGVLRVQQEAILCKYHASSTRFGHKPEPTGGPTAYNRKAPGWTCTCGEELVRYGWNKESLLLSFLIHIEEVGTTQSMRNEQSAMNVIH